MTHYTTTEHESPTQHFRQVRLTNAMTDILSTTPLRSKKDLLLILFIIDREINDPMNEDLRIKNGKIRAKALDKILIKERAIIDRLNIFPLRYQLSKSEAENSYPFSKKVLKKMIEESIVKRNKKPS